MYLCEMIGKCAILIYQKYSRYVYALQLTTTEETFSSTPGSGNSLLRFPNVDLDLLKIVSLKIPFNVQFSRMPGYVGVDVVSFRVGGPFVDLVITYAPPATDYATVLNTVFLLTKHGYIHYLHVHNYLRFDHVVKTGTCPPVLGLGPCNMNCTGDSKCTGKQKCCSNGYDYNLATNNKSPDNKTNYKTGNHSNNNNSINNTDI
uniref:Uncharacterized protein n=1 Tax=Magallana gigas TaxID=29159 RepID=K1QF42_MAGGI